MKNEEIIEIFQNIARLLQIKKSPEDKFRIIAYSRAAAILTESSDILDMEDPTTVYGIGKSIAEKIKEIKETGTCKFYEGLKKEIPMSLLEILKINNIGPATIHSLWKSGITTIGALDEAIKNRKVTLTNGQLEGYRSFKQSNVARMPYDDAIKIGQPILDYLNKSFKQIEFGGSLRRKKETIKDIDILICSNDPKKVHEVLSKYPNAFGLEGQTRIAHFFLGALRVDFLIVPEDEWGAALNHFTGSREHNVAIRSYAKKLGIKVNEKGYWKGKKKIGGSGSEKELYDILGIEYVVPEKRDGNINEKH